MTVKYIKAGELLSSQALVSMSVDAQSWQYVQHAAKKLGFAMHTPAASDVVLRMGIMAGAIVRLIKTVEALGEVAQSTLVIEDASSWKWEVVEDAQKAVNDVKSLLKDVDKP